MTPADVSGIAQTASLLTSVKSKSANQGGGASPIDLTESSSKDSRQPSVDTVNISEESRQVVNSVVIELKKADESKAKDKKPEDSLKSGNAAEAGGLMAKVQFVYDLKGDLSIRYLDTNNRIIYQVPSELMMQLAEAVSNSSSSVNTKV